MKSVDRERTTDLLQMLDLIETISKLARASGLNWYGHLQRNDINFFRETLDLNVKAAR